MKEMTQPVFTGEPAQDASMKKALPAQIDRIIPWGKWIEMIQPHYYKGERRKQAQKNLN